MLQEFVQEVLNAGKEGLADVHTAIPGKIVAVDPTTGTATVLPVMKMKAANGTSLDYPQISGVPIVFPQGAAQSVSIAYPVLPGDGCLLIIMEQSMDYWMYGRETGTNLKFDLTNAVCIPGMFATPSPALMEAVATSSIVLQAGGTSLKVGPGGITITGDVTVSGDVRASGKSLASHTHTDGDGATTSGPQ